MKKLCFLFLVVFCFAFLCSCGVKKVDNMKRENNTPPKKEISERETTLKDDGITVGIDKSEFSKDFIRAFSEESSIDVDTVVYTSFDDVKKDLENGKIQMYMGNFPKESGDTIDFCVSSPYLKGTSVVVSLNEDYDIDREKDLVGYIKNTSQELLVDNYCKNKKSYDNISSLMNALFANEVDCVLLDSFTFEKSGYSKNIYYVCDTYSYSLVAIFNQKESEFAKEVDLLLAKLKASGEADDISEKYFGENLILK